MALTRSDRTASVAALLGGALWALLPVWELLALPAGFGFIFHVLPLALILVGLVVLHRLHAGSYGRLGRIGFGVSLLGVSLMTIGNAVEVTSLSVTGEENEPGHLVFFLGLLLVLLPGSVLLGIAVWRAHRLPRARLGGGLLVTLLPLGVVLGALVGLVTSAESDTGFWAAIATPYGIAWTVLGAGLVATSTRGSTEPSTLGV